MSAFCLPEGYKENLAPAYEHDVQDGGIVYQPTVYADAYARHLEHSSNALFIDVGCGRASKLVALKDAATIGIDFGSNVDWLIREYPGKRWIAIDLEEGASIHEAYLMNATVVCADVIEHLKNPMHLLLDLAAWLDLAREVTITTPARDLHYGRTHQGPPRNRCHVREWNPDEFLKLLESARLPVADFRFVRSSTASEVKHTMQAICRLSK